jgi:hypothetical protein
MRTLIVCTCFCIFVMKVTVLLANKRVNDSYLGQCNPVSEPIKTCCG